MREIHLQLFAALSDGQTADGGDVFAVEERTSEEKNVSGENNDKRIDIGEEKEQSHDRGESGDSDGKENTENADSGYASLLQRLSVMYPEAAAMGENALINAFLEDKGGNAHADKREKAAGNTENADMEKKAEDGKNKQPSAAVEAVRAYLRQKTEREVRTYFEKEEAKIREIYPSFSLERELDSSPEFRQLLSAGISPRRAFETVNLEKIMGQALRYAVMSAGKKTADVMKNSARVSENSLLDTASSVKYTDVNNLTEKEIRRILSEVSKGAKITF